MTLIENFALEAIHAVVKKIADKPIGSFAFLLGLLDYLGYLERAEPVVQNVRHRIEKFIKSRANYARRKVDDVTWRFIENFHTYMWYVDIDSARSLFPPDYEPRTETLTKMDRVLGRIRLQWPIMLRVILLYFLAWFGLIFVTGLLAIGAGVYMAGSWWITITVIPLLPAAFFFSVMTFLPVVTFRFWAPVVTLTLLTFLPVATIASVLWALSKCPKGVVLTVAFVTVLLDYWYF
jgi:hypothetical protein